jgi:hypothetical protein
MERLLPINNIAIETLEQQLIGYKKSKIIEGGSYISFQLNFYIQVFFTKHEKGH